MEKHKVYCDECIYLEERPIKAEVPLDSGNYITTGTRFYCKLHDRWYSIGTTKEMIGFNYCVTGERMEQSEKGERKKW